MRALRDVAKLDYVKVCKYKSALHDKQQTARFLNNKHNDIKEYWAEIKPKPKRNTPPVSPPHFQTYFATLYKSHGPIPIDIHHDYSLYDDILDEPFTVHDIERAVHHLKSGKVAGEDNIKSDYILCEFKKFKHVLTLLFNKLYTCGYYPDIWSTGIIVPIFKSGDTHEPGNYRPITLTSTISKLFTYLLNQRLCQWLEISETVSETQFAYKCGYSTMDAIFVFKSVLDKAMCRSPGVYCIFVDFTKAFDSINREILYNKLIEYKVSSRMLRIIINMYSKRSSKIRTNSGTSMPFPQYNGLMQGDCLSPLLFSLYINELEIVMDSIEDLGYIIGKKKISILQYADDIVIFSSCKLAIQKALDALHSFCLNNKLTVNTKKTKAMYVSKRTPRDLAPTTYNGCELEWVDHFRYLGVSLSNTNKMTKGLQVVCQEALRPQAVIFMHMLKHRQVSINHLFSLFDTLLRPKLLYGCEIWGRENHVVCETFHLGYIKKVLNVKSTTNNCLIYTESVYWFKILNSDPKKLIYTVYSDMLSNPYTNSWLSHVKDILCTSGFGFVWEEQGVTNQKMFLETFEQRCKDMHAQQCLADIEISSKCKFYSSIKLQYGPDMYMDISVSRNIRRYYTKLRLSSHKLLVERGRWTKPKINYEDRKCTFCNSGEIDDEYHLVMTCDFFKDLRRKYIKPYYYRHPSMYKCIELFNNTNRRELFRLMLFIKHALTLYNDNLNIC